MVGLVGLEPHDRAKAAGRGVAHSAPAVAGASVGS
jgi:hypothetical protein